MPALLVDIAEKTGERQITLNPRRIYNLGSATRSPERAIAHQEEVKDIGVSIAFDIPAPRIYPLGPNAVVTDDEITVQGDRTSGEVEIVIVVADEIYVGVGSDHTDRALERTSIVWSKQACANVLAPRLWRWEDVKDRWDEFRLRSFVDGKLYQDCGVADFLSPPDMLAIVRARTATMPERDFMIFGGTIASVDKSVGFGTRWEIELVDPTGDRAIRHAYTVVNLMDEMRPEFRVPLARDKG
jgi:4-hydroxyphenylacetate 3-monooxygenase